LVRRLTKFLKQCQLVRGSQVDQCIEAMMRQAQSPPPYPPPSMKPCEAEDTSFTGKGQALVSRPPPAGAAELLAQAFLARGNSGLFGGVNGGEYLATGARVMAKFYGEWHKATVHSFRDNEVVVLWHSEASISVLPPCDVKLLDAPSSDIGSDLEGPQQQQQLAQLQHQQQVHLHLQLQLPLQQQVNLGAQNKGWTPLDSTGVVAPGLVGQAAEADRLLVSGARLGMGSPETFLDVHASDDTDTTDSNVLVEAFRVAVDRAGGVDATGTPESNTPAVPSRDEAGDTVMVPGVGKMRRRDLDLLRSVHHGEMDVEDDEIPDLSALSPEQMLHLEAFLDCAASPRKAASAALEQPQETTPGNCKKSGDDEPRWEERLSPYRGALLRKQDQVSTGTTTVPTGAPRSADASRGNTTGKEAHAPPGLER